MRDLGGCHRYIVCRTVAIAAYWLWAPFSSRCCCATSKSNETKRVASLLLHAAGKRTSVPSLWGDRSTRRSCSYPYPRTPTTQRHSRRRVKPKRAESFVDFSKEELVSQGRPHAALETLPLFRKLALRLLVPQGSVALPKRVHSVSDRCYRYTSGTSRFPPPRHQ